MSGLKTEDSYALNMPSGPEGVFTASVYPDDISGERVIHLDLAIALMAVSGAVMWWKRRPAGSVGAPTVPVLAIAIVAGLFFPLVGLSMIVFAVIEVELQMLARPRTALL